MEVALYPVEPAEAPYPIIEQGPKDIADRTIDNEALTLQTGGIETEHDSLTGERKETTSEESRYEHSPIAVVEEKISDGLRHIKNSSSVNEIEDSDCKSTCSKHHRKDIAQSGVREGEPVTDKRCRQHDGHTQEEVEMLRLDDSEEDRQRIKHDKQLIDHTDADTVLIAEYREMDTAENGTEQHEAEGNPLMEADVCSQEWLTELENTQEMSTEPVDLPRIDKPRCDEPIRRNNP